MGHRIAIMRDGVLQQVGPPQEVYDAPANLFVASFIGTPPMNTVPGKVVPGADGTLAVSLPGAEVALPADLAARLAERNVADVVIGVRPEHVLLRADGVLPAEVVVVESLGHERHVICRLVDGTMVITRQSGRRRRAGGRDERQARGRTRAVPRVRRRTRARASARHEVEAVLAAGHAKRCSATRSCCRASSCSACSCSTRSSRTSGWASTARRRRRSCPANGSGSSSTTTSSRPSRSATA